MVNKTINKEKQERTFEPWYRLIGTDHWGKESDLRDAILVNPLRNISIPMKSSKYGVNVGGGDTLYEPSLADFERELISSYHNQPNTFPKPVKSKTNCVEGIFYISKRIPKKYTLFMNVDSWNLHFTDPFPLSLAVLDEEGKLREIRDRISMPRGSYLQFDQNTTQKKLDQEAIDFLKKFMNDYMGWIVKRGGIQFEGYHKFQSEGICAEDDDKYWNKLEKLIKRHQVKI